MKNKRDTRRERRNLELKVWLLETAERLECMPKYHTWSAKRALQIYKERLAAYA